MMVWMVEVDLRWSFIIYQYINMFAAELQLIRWLLHRWKVRLFFFFFQNILHECKSTLLIVLFSGLDGGRDEILTETMFEFVVDALLPSRRKLIDDCRVSIILSVN